MSLREIREALEPFADARKLFKPIQADEIRKAQRALDELDRLRPPVSEREAIVAWLERHLETLTQIPPSEWLPAPQDLIWIIGRIKDGAHLRTEGGREG